MLLKKEIFVTLKKSIVNKNINLLVFIVSSGLSILAGCNNNNIIDTKNNNNILKFDLTNWENGKLLPNKVIKDFNLIQLETNDNCLIGVAEKIIVKKDKIYVLDSSSKKIFIFSKLGKYLNNIGSYGKGPGEILSLRDFIIDENDDKLFILDSNQRKVLIYDLQSFKLIKEFKIPFLATNFGIINDSLLSFYSRFKQNNDGTNYSIATYNTKNDSYKWYLPQDEYEIAVGYPHSLFQSSNLYFASFFKDIVYKIQVSDIEPYIIFDFGNDKIPRDLIKNTPLNKILKMLNEKAYTYGIENVFENSNFICFDLNLKDQINFVIYAKNSKNFFYGNKFEGSLGVFKTLKIIAVNSNEFYGMVDALQFRSYKRLILESQDIKLRSKYLQLFNSNSEQSNPILVAIEYNNF